MSSWLLGHEAQVRLTVFLTLFGLFLVLQRVRPLRQLPGGWRRQGTNLALVVIDTAILRVAFPLLAFDLATRLDAAGGGLLQALPPVAAVVVGVLLLDVAIYWQHRILHVVPMLWRLHRVHHAEPNQQQEARAADDGDACGQPARHGGGVGVARSSGGSRSAPAGRSAHRSAVVSVGIEALPRLSAAPLRRSSRRAASDL